MDDPLHDQFREIHAKVKERFRKLRAFWRTRRAILKGAPPLWDLDKERRAELGFLQPVPFNLAQTGISAAVGAVIVYVGQLLIPELNLQARGSSEEVELSKLVQKALSVLQPFTAPIVLTAFVFPMGWGTLRRHRSNRASRARARTAYLYFDGAYGLWPQMLIAAVAGLLTVLFPIMLLVLFKYPIWFTLLGGLFLFAVACQFHLTVRKIPRLMFQVNGHPSDPPWGKLLSAMLVSALATGYALNKTMVALAYAFAHAVTWARQAIA